MATHTYRAYNKRTGAALTPAFSGILADVALTGVETTSGSNIVTVASTTGLYPWMGLSIAGLPLGSFIKAIRNGTQIEAYCPVYDTATGTFTVTAANAYATASTSGATILGTAHGCNSVAIPFAQHDGQTYRNSVPSSFTNASVSLGPPYVSAPLKGGMVATEAATISAITDSGTSFLTVSAVKPAASDAWKGTPPRPRGLWTSFYFLVGSEGMVTRIPAGPEVSIVRTA